MHEKKQFIRKMYTSLADRYDLANRVISWGRDRRWRDKAVAGLPHEGWIADLGGGTGDLTMAYYKSGHPDASIVFVDFNKEMIMRARQKFDRSAWRPQVFFVLADVEKLPLKSSCCAGAMSAFVLRNLPSVELIAAEAHRILTDEGKAAFLDATRPPRGWFRGLFDVYFQQIMPRLGSIINFGQRRAYRYLAGSVIELPPAGQLVQKFRQAGFVDCRFLRVYRGMATIFLMGKGQGCA